MTRNTYIYFCLHHDKWCSVIIVSLHNFSIRGSFEFLKILLLRTNLFNGASLHERMGVKAIRIQNHQVHVDKKLIPMFDSEKLKHIKIMQISAWIFFAKKNRWSHFTQKHYYSFSSLDTSCIRLAEQMHIIILRHIFVISCYVFSTGEH